MMMWLRLSVALEKEVRRQSRKLSIGSMLLEGYGRQ